MRILVADDEPFNLDLIEMVLVRDGHTVKAVSDGVRALASLNDESYDLIITDFNMPNIDGLTLAKQIKEQNPNQKIVLLTGFGNQGKLPPNIDAVLSKPVQIDALQGVIKRFTT